MTYDGTLGQVEKYHAFFWQAGSPLRDLGTLGGLDSTAYGINNYGQIVGLSWTARRSVSGATYRAFLWQDGSSMRDLGTLGGQNSEARAINDRGQVVGRASTAAGVYHAFLWQDGSPMQDLLGTVSDAAAINSTGQVVGGSYMSDGNYRAFLWQSGSGMSDIGTLGGLESIASDINDSGIAVGYSSVATNPNATHAFVWQLGSTIQDLGTLGGANSFAYGINSSSQIVGSAEDVNGIMHAVLWEPVPEPSSILALAGWTAGLGGFVLKRKRSLVNLASSTIPGDTSLDG